MYLVAQGYGKLNRTIKKTNNYKEFNIQITKIKTTSKTSYWIISKSYETWGENCELLNVDVSWIQLSLASIVTEFVVVCCSESQEAKSLPHTAPIARPTWHRGGLICIPHCVSHVTEYNSPIVTFY